MRQVLFVTLLFALLGCESTKPAAKPDVDAATSDDKPAPPKGGQADAGTAAKDAGSNKPSTAASKLDRPNTLPRPPRGGLPPELIPPR